MRKLTTLANLILLLFVTSATTPGFENKRYTSSFDNVLGTSLEIKIDAVPSASPEKAEAAILNEIDRLNAILSSYNEQSEFRIWERSKGAPVKVSEELFEVLDLFGQWKKESGGALTASAENIGKVWKNAAKIQKLPSFPELKHAVGQAAAVQWVLNNDRSVVHTGDARLALNSFVKSYILNKAADAALQSHGITGVLLNMGGDIVVRGSIIESVDISNPRTDAENDLPVATISVQDRAVATSGNYRRGYRIGEKWYSHIINPLTGMPAEEIISATVVAENPTVAGALATAFNVLSVKESITLAARYPGTEYLIIRKNGKEIKSAGWKAMELKPPPLADKHVRDTKPGRDWNTKFELLVNLELALIEGQRIHRPFVAVWIEDANKKPVRNIAVWYNKPKWLPDLKNWYRTYGLDFGAAGNPVKSTSSATRSPGTYSLKWDGKDDKGIPVKTGDYIVNIEVAREHGTYQLISQKMNLDATANKITLPKNVEVASASLDYRKKSK